MKLTRTYLSAIVGAALLMSVGLTGCGKPAADGDSKGGATAETKLKVGVGMPMTQGATFLGEDLDRAARLAVEKANASERAKALGITFEVTTGDDLGDPKAGVNVANMFASDPAVVGVMGHLNSGVCIPASKVYSDAKLPMVAPAATDPTLTKQGLNNVFRLCTVDTIQGEFAADSMLTKAGAKTAYVVDDSTTYGSGLAARFAEVFAAKGGKVLGTEKTSDKDSDFNALCTKINALKPDVVYYGGIYNSGSILLKQLRAAGYEGDYMGGDGLQTADFVKLAGEKEAEGAYATVVGLPLDKLEAGAEFKAEYEATYPGKEMSPYSAYGFDCTNVIIDAALTAAEQVGADQVTTPAGRDAIIAAVAATKTTGLTGPIEFDEFGDTLNKQITLFTVKNGEYVVVE